MKNLTAILITLSVAVLSCSDVKRSRGREYMPDMAYSRAFETYQDHGSLKERGINYTAMPVAGTIQRGETFPFSIPLDKEGDSSNYVASKQVVNPLAEQDSIQLKEAERLYLINCAICHGTNLEGNGPLYNGGNGPYPAAPKNLVGDPVVSVMPQGQMFYSVTYGKGAMGPYSSQLSTSQRWRIVEYVKRKQLAKKGGDAGAGGTSEGSGGASAADGSTSGAASTGAATNTGTPNPNANPSNPAN